MVKKQNESKIQYFYIISFTIFIIFIVSKATPKNYLELMYVYISSNQSECLEDICYKTPMNMLSVSKNSTTNILYFIRGDLLDTVIISLFNVDELKISSRLLKKGPLAANDAFEKYELTLSSGKQFTQILLINRRDQIRLLVHKDALNLKVFDDFISLNFSNK